MLLLSGLHRRLAGLVAFLVVCSLSAARADVPIVVTLTSDAYTITADSHSRANILIQAWLDGARYTGALQVQVLSTLGQLDPTNVTVTNGSAWTHLRSSGATGTAVLSIQVTSDQRLVVVPSPIAITFVAPGSHISTVNQRFMTVRGDDLTYSIQTGEMSALQRCSLSFRGVSISADQLSVNVSTLEVRAQSLSNKPVHVTGRGKSFDALKVYLNYSYNMGEALVVGQNGSVALNAFSPDQMILKTAVVTQPPDAFTMPDGGAQPIVVRASRMDLYPGNEIHCTHTTFYVASKKVMYLPYYRLSLSVYNPSADQYLNYDTTSGLGVDVPLYYMLNDSSMGSIRIQDGPLYNPVSGGWALGIRQAYGQSVVGIGPSLGSGGAVTLDHITQSNWGYSWQHNQRFGSSGLFSSYIYSPDHEAVSANTSTYMTVDGLGLSWGNYGTHSASGDLVSSQFEVDLPQKALLHRRVLLNLSGLLGGQYSRVAATSTTAGTSTLGFIPGAGATMYLVPWRLDHATTIGPTVSTRYLLPSTGGYHSSNASLTLIRQIGRAGSVGLTYGWSAMGSTGTQPGFVSQTISGNLFTLIGRHLRISASPSYYLTAHSLFAYSSVAYYASPVWTFDVTGQVSSGFSASMNDWQVGVSRMFLGRSVRLYYTGLLHQVKFEVLAGQFY
jgi:hypothetical protein